MEKYSKKEVVEHIRMLDKQATNIFNVVVSDNKISGFKIQLYLKQISCICDEFAAAKDIYLKLLNKEKNQSLLKLILVFLLAIIAFAILNFVSFPVGMVLMSVSILVNGLVIKHSKEDLEKDAIINTEINDLVSTFSCTLSNCSVFLKKHYDKQSKELLNAENKENFANFVIGECLEANLVDADQELSEEMIRLLQREFNTDEKDLKFLMQMGRDIYRNRPFATQTDDVLKLTR